MADVANMNDYRQRHKQLDVTDEMLEQINLISGSNLSGDDVVVFEATALNTQPLNKAGSIFDQGRVTVSTLREMAAALNSGDESVPLHTLHQQGDELPVGRVFHGYVQDTVDGGAELRAQFYLPRSEAQLIEKMNMGILDEVSVGLKSKSLSCSKCGFDYFGEDADFLHLWDRTCDNGHTIGVDGTHAILQGMDKWMELSLVSRGAAHKAKIHGRAKKLLPQEQHDRIAASGYEPDAVTLFASATLSKTRTKEDPMSKETQTSAGEAEFDAKAAHEELVAKMGEIAEALGQMAEGQKQEDEAKAAAEAEAKAAEEASEIEDLKAQIADLTGTVKELSEKPRRDPAEFAADAPAGGVSAAAVSDANRSASATPLSAFKARK